MTEATAWTGRIRDVRSWRVIFLVHWLLDENTCDLGGARRGGAVREIVDLCQEEDMGMCRRPAQSGMPEEACSNGDYCSSMVRR